MHEDERHINLHATPEMMAGVYANFANVSHSDYEFSITFVRLDHESEEPGELNGVVVSRVNLSPRFMKELVDAMNDNYGKWLQAENIKNLPVQLKTAAKVHPDIAVILRAEGEIKYQVLLDLLDEVKLSGIAKVGLAVDSAKKNGGQNKT